MQVSEVNITPIKPSDGLIAFASCVVDKKLYLGSIGVHTRPKDGSYRITYPTKKVGARAMDYFHPINREMSKAIEIAITEKCEEVFERGDESNDRYDKVITKNN